MVSEIAPQLKRVDFVVANTDSQGLKEAAKEAKIFQFGQNLTKGLGCGMDPRIGQKAAQEEKQRIAKFFKGIDLTILIASLGGGTGSGAAPEFAKIAKDSGVITFGIFTLPFRFEGGKRMQIAKNSLEKLTPNLNTMAIIPNENIFRIIDKDTPIINAFSAINEQLSENLRGLIEMIYLPGLINIDFADLRTTLDGKGRLAYLNSSQAQGSNRAEQVIKELLKSPLVEYNIKGGQRILFNITASQDLKMEEVEQISKTILDYNHRAKIIFGVSQNDDYKDRIRVTLLAVGCGKEPLPKRRASVSPRVERGERKPEPETQSQLKPKPEPKPEPKPRRNPPSQMAAAPKGEPRHFGQGARSIKLSGKPRRRKPTVHPLFPHSTQPKAKKEISPATEELPQSESESEKEEPKTIVRRNALELKKAAEKIEQDLLEQEKIWDIPAFLRRQKEI